MVIDLRSLALKTQYTVNFFGLVLYIVALSWSEPIARTAQITPVPENAVVDFNLSLAKGFLLFYV
jgi:hypothetical protein